MNNAALNIHVQISVWTYVFHILGYIPSNGIAGSYDNSILPLETWPDCFSKQLCHFTSPHQGCGFSTSLLTFIIYLFDYSHPSACEVVSRGFDLHFSDS